MAIFGTYAPFETFVILSEHPRVEGSSHPKKCQSFVAGASYEPYAQDDKGLLVLFVHGAA